MKKQVLSMVLAISLLLCGYSNTSSNTPSNTSPATTNDRPAPSIPGNGKHFVKYDGKIYFRIPCKAAMREAALWGDYDHVMADDSSIIAALDPKTNEIENLFTDSSYGPITISGGRFILAESSGGQETNVQSVSFDGTDRFDLPGTSVYGTLPSGEYFVTGAYEADHKLHLYICDSKGDSKEIKNSTDIIYYAGLSDDKLFCVTSAKESNYGRLTGYDLKTGEEIVYGDFPKIVDYADYPAEPEYLTVKDNILLVQMSVYEGSGHFYAGCKHFRAMCDEPGSLEESFPAGVPEQLNAGDLKSPTVMGVTPAGRFRYAVGVTGTCGVDDEGRIGYFNGIGEFVPVKSGYGFTLYDNYQDRANTEYAQLIDNDIYVVRNAEEYAPEACIGWRDAYRRYDTKIERINIIKKNVTPVARIVSDPLKDLVAGDILVVYRAKNPIQNNLSVEEEAHALGLWVQDNIGKENFPPEILQMGKDIGNRYEFCFGTDISNNFDDNFPRIYETYYALKDYYYSKGRWSSDYYKSLMEENELLGNGDPQNIRNMYSDMQAFITACNNILRRK